MDESKKEFGKRLAEVRKSKKIKQEEFKELIGAPTVQMISGWENGHSFPSPTYLIIIAKKLDISLDYLLLGREKESQDKTIRTYKDAAIAIVELIKCNLFDISSYLSSDSFGKTFNVTTLSSSNKKINSFREELDNLLVASKSLRPELFNQAVDDLLGKYDILIKTEGTK